MDNPVRVVEVVTYDPAWQEQFENERRLLADVLPQAVSIEHIGSTSVPGLAAKPIIDIIAVVPDVEEIAADVSALERHGYLVQWGAEPLIGPAAGNRPGPPYRRERRGGSNGLSAPTDHQGQDRQTPADPALTCHQSVVVTSIDA